MDAGGLDREAAEGEAAGADFRLGAFHDQLLSYGSLPLSIVEWLMLGDSTFGGVIGQGR